MTRKPVQTFENHAVTPWTLFYAALLMFAGIMLALAGLIFVKHTAGICLIGTGLILNGFGGIYGLLICREYAVKLQDRIIRTEMWRRLNAILPENRRDEIGKLTMRQLISLRFASDAELPALIRKTLDEDIQDGALIKKLIKDWQPDYDRV